MIWEQTFQPFGGVYQNVGNITGRNQLHFFSGYEYFEANYPTTGAVGDLAMTWFGPGTIGGGAPGLARQPCSHQPNTVTTGAWTQYTLSNALAPAGATQVEVSFDFTSSTQTGGALGGFIDDADLEGAGIVPTTAQWAVPAAATGTSAETGRQGAPLTGPDWKPISSVRSPRRQRSIRILPSPSPQYISITRTSMKSPGLET